MKRQIAVDSKVGLLDDRTGRYKWSTVVKFLHDNETVLMSNGCTCTVQSILNHSRCVCKRFDKWYAKIVGSKRNYMLEGEPDYNKLALELLDIGGGSTPTLPDIKKFQFKNMLSDKQTRVVEQVAESFLVNP